MLTHLTVNSNHLETHGRLCCDSWLHWLYYGHMIVQLSPFFYLTSYSPPLLFFDLRAGDTNTHLLMSATQQLLILSIFTVLCLWVPFMVKRSLFIKRESFVYGYKEEFRHFTFNYKNKYNYLLIIKINFHFQSFIFLL